MVALKKTGLTAKTKFNMIPLSSAGTDLFWRLFSERKFFNTHITFNGPPYLLLYPQSNDASACQPCISIYCLTFPGGFGLTGS